MNSKVTALYCVLSEVEQGLPRSTRDQVSSSLMAQRRLGTGAQWRTGMH